MEKLDGAPRTPYNSLHALKSSRTMMKGLHQSVWAWERRKRAIDKQRDEHAAGLRAVLGREPTDAEIDKFLKGKK